MGRAVPSSRTALLLGSGARLTRLHIRAGVLAPLCPSSLLHKGIVIRLLLRAELNGLNEECPQGASPRARHSVTPNNSSIAFTVTVLVPTGL